MNLTTGKYIYGFRTNTVKELTSYNILRHAGSTWSLIVYYEKNPNEKLKQLIENSIDYLLDNYLVDYLYMNDYEYTSLLMDKVNSSLVGSYTEEVILTSNEIITLDDLTINIYPYMEDEFSLEDKTLIIEMILGDNSIYLTSNSSNKRLSSINKSTLLVSENSNLFKISSKYFEKI